MTRSFDAIVLGAGIVGSACAMECSQAGMRVGIVEPSVPGGGATAAGMGHIVVMDDSPAQLALSHYSQSLWRQLRPALPAGVEYDECGTLWVAADDEELAEVHSKYVASANRGIQTEILGPEALAQAEPNLRPGLAGALLAPNDGVIYPPAAAAFFLKSALLANAELLRGQAAISVGAGIVRLKNGSRLATGRIIVATGADLRLLPRLPVAARKGHLVITDRYPGFAHRQLVELGYLKSAHKVAADSVAFNVQPRPTGQLLIGSSRQYGREDAAVDHAILGQMLARAQSYMPRLAQLSAIRIWTGFRAATPDKLPYIGPTEDPTLFVAAGFEGLGITNAPGAGRLLAAHVLGRKFDIDPSPYLPSRARVPEPSHA